MKASAEAEEKSVTINIRASQRKRDLIDQAARLAGKTRTEFMLDTACRAAEDALLDRRLIGLDEEAYGRFVAMLDAPASPSLALKALLARPAPWEK